MGRKGRKPSNQADGAGRKEDAQGNLRPLKYAAQPPGPQTATADKTGGRPKPVQTTLWRTMGPRAPGAGTQTSLRPDLQARLGPPAQSAAGKPATPEKVDPLAKRIEALEAEVNRLRAVADREAGLRLEAERKLQSKSFAEAVRSSTNPPKAQGTPTQGCVRADKAQPNAWRGAPAGRKEGGALAARGPPGRNVERISAKRLNEPPRDRGPLASNPAARGPVVGSTVPPQPKPCAPTGASSPNRLPGKGKRRRTGTPTGLTPEEKRMTTKSLPPSSAAAGPPPDGVQQTSGKTHRGRRRPKKDRPARKVQRTFHPPMITWGQQRLVVRHDSGRPLTWGEHGDLVRKFDQHQLAGFLAGERSAEVDSWTWRPYGDDIRVCSPQDAVELRQGIQALGYRCETEAEYRSSAAPPRRTLMGFIRGEPLIERRHLECCVFGARQKLGISSVLEVSRTIRSPKGQVVELIADEAAANALLTGGGIIRIGHKGAVCFVDKRRVRGAKL